jgi:hypothetical protein
MLKDFWRNIFQHLTPNPRIMPKRVLLTIPKGDGGGGIK